MKNKLSIIKIGLLAALNLVFIGCILLSKMKTDSYRALADAINFENKNDIIKSKKFDLVEHLSNYNFVKQYASRKILDSPSWNKGLIEVYSVEGIPIRFAIFIIEEKTQDILLYYWAPA
jgi:hypothetical protein